MAPQTFHYFSTLPKADRELIWALAIRPERPSAHVFTLYNAKENTERLLLSQYTAGHPTKPGYALAAPPIGRLEDGKDENDNHEHQFSWDRGNRSAYMIDAGLWTACRESRAVIERRFQVVEYQTLATTWLFSSAEPQRCLMDPDADLFFIRPLNPETTDWDSMSGLPLSTGERSVEGAVYHVALASDIIPSTWDGPGTECAVNIAAGRLGRLESLWFVNYSLRREVGVTCTPKRRQFHGHGCVFTEVVEGDMDWYDGSGPDTNKGVHPDDFLDPLEGRVMDVLYDENMPSPDYRLLDGRSMDYRPSVGILVYEEYTP
jgi:hypothetical protein